MRSRRRAKPSVTARAFVAVPLLALGLIACSGSDDNGSSESVFKVKPGECFTTPGTVKAELSALTHVACSKPHTQEAYAIVGFRPSSAALATGAPSGDSAFPGADVLTTFAKGVCAQRFTGYVGVDYLDSSLYFTYLLPSARSWEQNDDHEVLCFVTTTGQKLTLSVKNSKK